MKNTKTVKSRAKRKNKVKEKVLLHKKNRPLLITSIVFLGITLIAATYAWFSTNLNVRVKTFNMIVTKNSGLQISFDAINYDNYVEISRETLINNLKNTYPNNTSQWAAMGLTPVSTLGVRDSNTSKFEIYSSAGVMYRNKRQQNGFVNTKLLTEGGIYPYSSFIAFDLFVKNDTGSPVDDNLFLDFGTEVTIEDGESEEMQGLVNSTRIGFVKVGSASLDTDYRTIQNLSCNNNCKSIIFEPNSRIHTNMSKEKAKEYGINLKDGEKFPTYAYKKAGGPIYVKDTVSGSSAMDMNYFEEQQTITDTDFDTPLFSIPNGVTKMRVYVWIEGQDIDSLETDSSGAELAISINFIKDTTGYTSFN